MTRYREIDVAGLPRELGRQVGEAAREETRGFCDVALERVQKTVAISDERALRIARASARHAERYRPDLMEELRGVAEGAGVSLDAVMLLQVRNQLTADPEAACTSLSIAGGEAGCLVAQTWDNDPALDEFTVVLTRRPADGPATLCCTQAGLIAYMGLSDNGMGACVNTLPAPSRESGVPHYFTLRELLEAPGLAAAARAVERAERAIPANIMLATPEGPADLEVTLDGVKVLRPLQHGIVRSGACALGHTNHCVDAALLSHNDAFPELIQSHARKRRVDKLLEQWLPSAPAQPSRTQTREAVEAILRDHDGYPQSICRHANDDPEYGFWQTVFALIIEPAAGELHVARGTPCEQPFETYRLR